MNEHLAKVLVDLEAGKLDTGELLHDALQMVRWNTRDQELSREDEARFAVLELYAKDGQLW